MEIKRNKPQRSPSGGPIFEGRGNAARAANRRRDPGRTSSRFTAALADAPDAESRRAIVSSLARVADAASFGLLLELAQSDPDHETRCQAMQGLGMIGNPLAIEPLRAIESSAADTREQSYARTAIQRIQSNAATQTAPGIPD